MRATGNDAFLKCKSMKKISLPEGLKSVGSYAFFGCDSLQEIILPESMESIERNAFLGCDSLKRIALSKDKWAVFDVVYIPDFYKCPYDLTGVRNCYLDCINIDKKGKLSIDYIVFFEEILLSDFVDGLSVLDPLAKLSVFTEENIDSAIEVSGKSQKTEIVSWLMNYKNSKFGIAENGYDL